MEADDRTAIFLLIVGWHPYVAVGGTSAKAVGKMTAENLH
jgi:hypothetical protein